MKGYVDIVSHEVDLGEENLEGDSVNPKWF